MNEPLEKGTRKYALADVLSRRNALNGLYKKLKLPLGYDDLKNKDAIFITHIANLADKEIKEAEERGDDLSDSKVQQKIQAAVYGGITGGWFATLYFKILKKLGITR